MAGGGSFFSNDEFKSRGLAGASDDLWNRAQTVQQQSTALNQGMQQAFGAYNNARAGVQPMGDALAATSRHLERLNENLQRSPLLSGRPMAGGAVMSGGQMYAASLGMSVQVPGLYGGAETMGVAREMMQQQASLATQRLARSALTQGVPAAIGLATAFMPGGAIAAPLLAGAAQVMMPSVMRATGIDAILAREETTRDIQMTVGERMGHGLGVTERFRMGRQRAQQLSGHVTDYIRDTQGQYTQGGVFNFGLNAEDYKPLVGAAMNLSQTKDLKKLVADGGEGIKEHLTQLTQVAAALGSTFAEVGALAEQYGSTAGGVRGFTNFANMIEKQAGAAGGGFDRGRLFQFGVAVRDQARLAGMDGDTAAQNVVGTAASIQRMANESLLGFNQLASFGGRDEQERAQNMAASIFRMQTGLAQSGFGNLVRLNIMGGAAGGGIGDPFSQFAGRAGAQFAQDPFAYLNSRADAGLNQQVAAAAPLAYIGQLERIGKMFGDPTAGRGMFVGQAGQFGMTEVQAGGIYDFYRQNSDEAGEIGAGHGMSGDQLLGSAMGYAQRTGQSVFTVINDLKTKKLSVDQVKDTSAQFSMGDFGGGVSEADAAARIQNARSASQAEYKQEVYRETHLAEERMHAAGGSSSGWGLLGDAITSPFQQWRDPVGFAKKRVMQLGLAGHGVLAWGRETFTGEGAEREQLAVAQEEAAIAKDREGAFLSPRMRQLLSSNAALFSEVGIDPSKTYASAADMLSGFDGTKVGMSDSFNTLVTGNFADAGALQTVMGKEGAERSQLMNRLNDQLGRMSPEYMAKLRGQFGQFFSSADDNRVTLDEAEGRTGRLHGLLTKLNGDTNGSLVTGVMIGTTMTKSNMYSAAENQGASFVAALQRQNTKDNALWVKEAN